MTATSTRRAILAGAASLPALSLPALSVETDRVFAAIDRHEGLARQALELTLEIDEAEGKVYRQTKKFRPTALVRWRGYDIGGAEIDKHREQLLAQGKLKPKTIEREYLQAKPRASRSRN